ncbi:MAG TPA: class I SAM-dependent methyltransferase [Granulicella sp.]|jgi:hypothetical protein|nr:class I SAM-dependent methyltransferase [Granulicella sp.]
MRRTELIELHDHPRFPARLRDLMTDTLQELWRFGNSYGAILPQLHRGLTAAGVSAADAPSPPKPAGEQVDVLDLCSGGGGPWPRLARDLERDYGLAVRVCLTDKYPNLQALARPRSAEEETHLDYVPQPVDAAHVHPALSGFRTIFSSFHHFSPTEAREVLRSAMTANRGIGIFELARRELKTVLVLCLAPLLVLLLTPRMRPFRWSRLLWTYVVPVIPFVIWFDGLVSCLRAYAPEELQEMLAQLGSEPTGLSQASYRWFLGEERSGLLPVTYLIGYPEMSPP